MQFILWIFVAVSPLFRLGSSALTSRKVNVSGDGRDLVIMSEFSSRVLFIQNFERICRGETSLGLAGLSLNIQPLDVCCYLAFEHGRVCVATVRISQAPLVNAHADVGL